MHPNSKNNSPRPFAETVSLNRGRVYFGGGYVRDQQIANSKQETGLGRDIDIEVHGLMRRLFAGSSKAISRR